MCETEIINLGRARAHGSKSVLITLDGSTAEDELKNLQKEKLMDACIKHLRTYGRKYFKEKVCGLFSFVTFRPNFQVNEKIQQKQKDREIDRTRIDLKRRQFGNKV